MTIVTPEEIAKFRSELANDPEALEALDVVEECKGNLEDATEVLMVQVGKDIFRLENEDDDDEDLLKKLADKLRPFICTKEFENAFLNGSFAVIVTALSVSAMAPVIVVTPVVLYVSHKKLNNFCKDYTPQS
jgi:hypothetical protein